jgi:hypothetical protein
MSEERKKTVGRTELGRDPMAFWVSAVSLGAELANEGRHRSTDPLVWVAALDLAKEAVFKAADSDVVMGQLRKDYDLALEAKAGLAKLGVVLGVQDDLPEGAMILPEGLGIRSLDGLGLDEKLRRGFKS